LHFNELQDLCSGLLPSLYIIELVSKIILFRDDIVPLFLSRVGNAELHSGNHKRNRFRYHSKVLDLPLDCAKLGCFVASFFIA